MYIKNTKYNDEDKFVVGLISFIVALAVITIICVFTHNDNNSDTSNSTVRVIESGLGYAVWVDDETNVMYLRVADGTTVMLNSDGTPKLYKGE